MKKIATLEHQDLLIPSGCHFGLSYNGKYLSVGSQNGNIFIFDLESYKVEEIFTGEHSTPVLGCDWDPTWGSRLATIDQMGSLLIWE